MDVTRYYTKIYVIKMCQIGIGVYIKYTFSSLTTSLLSWLKCNILFYRTLLK